MVINHNQMALNTFNNLTSAGNAQAKSMEKLSSGLRINRAGDDAAGLAISEKMRAQIRGLDQSSRNAQDGISLIQTAEGALSETHSILQRMNELATQAANGTLSANDRNAIGSEMTKLTDEIDRIANSTKFNGQTLLNGNLGVQSTGGTATVLPAVKGVDVSGAKASEDYTITGDGTSGYTISDAAGDNTQTITVTDGAGVLDFDRIGVKITVDATNQNTNWTAGLHVTTGASANVSIQIGSEDAVDQRLGISIANMDAASLGVDAIDVSSATAAQGSMTTIQGAIDRVSLTRADIGSYQNRLEHTINNLNTSSENLTAAESRIRDVDMAKEMMTNTKNNILQQAAQAMLAQANQAPQGVLQLLR